MTQKLYDACVEITCHGEHESTLTLTLTGVPHEHVPGLICRMGAHLEDFIEDQPGAPDEECENHA